MRLAMWAHWRPYLIAAAVALASSTVLVGCDAGDDDDQRQMSAIATCGADDNPETGLQGQSTPVERSNGSAAKGINCNLKLVGQFRGEGAYHAQTWIDDCAYYSTANSAQQANPGVAVIDASDPAKPVATGYMNAPGMLQTWESLKMSTERKLVAAILNNTPNFAVYDVTDCKRPVLRASVVLPDPAIRGHGGAIAPDGRTYYVATFPVSLAIIDISNPANPVLMTNWIPTPGGNGFPHDLSISRDNNRAYILQPGSTGRNGVVILDVSDFNLRRPNPQVRIISTVFWPEGGTGMTSEEITIGGKPFLLVSDETQSGSRTNACNNGTPLFGFGRLIDISDINNPVVTTKLTLEVDDPANCAKLAGDPGFTTNSFGYSAHYCTADNREDTRLVACSRHEAGVRVFDVRDLKNPREIAYYKPPIRTGENLPGSGINGTVTRTYDWSKSHSRFLRRNGRVELWTTSADNGFQVLAFSDSVVFGNRPLFDMVPSDLETITVP